MGQQNLEIPHRPGNLWPKHECYAVFAPGRGLRILQMASGGTSTGHLAYKGEFLPSAIRELHYWGTHYHLYRFNELNNWERYDPAEADEH